jgi:ribosomal protein S18 acetylase RimI-like enzyme
LLRIRECQSDDMLKVVEIYNAARFPEACFVNACMSEQKFSTLIRNEKLHLAIVDDVMVGFVSILPPERFIHHLYILPKFQSQGIGSTLIRHCLQGYGRPLSLKSLAANNRACDYYESNGWCCEETGAGPDGPYRHYWLR